MCPTQVHSKEKDDGRNDNKSDYKTDDKSPINFLLFLRCVLDFPVLASSLTFALRVIMYTFVPIGTLTWTIQNLDRVLSNTHNFAFIIEIEVIACSVLEKAFIFGT